MRASQKCNPFCSIAYGLELWDLPVTDVPEDLQVAG
jgi:hypothetical protein